MIAYLGCLITEYQRALRTSAGDPPTIDSRNVKHFWAFLGMSASEDKKSMENSFSRPFVEVSRMIDELTIDY